MSTEPKRSYDYINQSRGHKTKGNSYKDRYVEAICPECGNAKAYKDTWKTRIAYTCLKRSCRRKWYIEITPEERRAMLDESSQQDAQEVEKG